jgi:hypothetical protein
MDLADEIQLLTDGIQKLSGSGYNPTHIYMHRKDFRRIRFKLFIRRIMNVKLNKDK